MASGSFSLSESLRRDQRERWSRGERVLVESYLEQFPALSGDTHALLDLVLGEFSLRRDQGETPSFDEYAERFPALRNQLSQALHDAPGAPPIRPSGDTDPGLVTDVGTQPIDCPYCAVPVRLSEGAEPGELCCPQCQRQIDLLDETLTVRVQPGRKLGVFELVRRVGSGQFGEVWLAHDSKLRRDVAVKLPRGAEDDVLSAALFMREARASSRLRHPHVVPVYEVGSDGGVAYIVTAFIHGTTLKDLLTCKKYTSQEAAALCRTLAEATHHAHQAGVIHRDLKPSNILIDGQGAPYITDFGLAKHSAGEVTITIDGKILGTPAYMSPEQARGEAGRADAATDVYSLGVILYELLTGRRPFSGRLQVLLYQIQHVEPQPPRSVNKHIPRDLETICLKAMAKTPAARYATAQDLADDLDRFLRGQPIRARRPSLAERAVRQARRSWLLAAFALAACVAAVGLIFGFNRGRPDVEHRPAPQVLPPIAELFQPEEEPPSADFIHRVFITTEPRGANVVCYPLEWNTGRPIFAGQVEAGVTPVTVELASGTYLVVAYTDNGFHEVVRRVPRRPRGRFGDFRYRYWSWDDGTKTLTWRPIQIFPRELPDEVLVPCPGSPDFQIDLAPLEDSRRRWRVPPFSIEPTEVSVGKFARFQRAFLMHHGQAEILPAGDISFKLAMAYAESRGMRLPDLLEVELLIAADGKRADMQPPITGLRSGVLEWTMTRTHLGKETEPKPGQRYVVYGGVAPQINQWAQRGKWVSVNEHMSHRGLGFPCVRSPGPRLHEQDFIAPLP